MFAITRLDSTNMFIQIGTGSRVGHVALALWMDGVVCFASCCSTSVLVLFLLLVRMLSRCLTVYVVLRLLPVERMRSGVREALRRIVAGPLWGDLHTVGPLVQSLAERRLSGFVLAAASVIQACVGASRFCF